MTQLCLIFLGFILFLSYDIFLVFFRSMNVSWELIVSSCTGCKITKKQSQVHFFESSVILSWTQGFSIKYKNISSIQLYGVRKETSRTR